MAHKDPQVKVRLKPEVKTWVEQKAKAEERSQAWLINHLIQEAMRHEQQAAPQK